MCLSFIPYREIIIWITLVVFSDIEFRKRQNRRISIIIGTIVALVAAYFGHGGLSSAVMGHVIHDLVKITVTYQITF
jgi:hypothetical protein